MEEDTIAPAPTPVISCRPKTVFILTIIAVIAASSWALNVFFGGPVLAAGLQYRLLIEDLEEVSALALAADSSLYATLEKSNGLGQVVRIRRGETTTLLENLDKPDGILIHGGSLYVTSESGDRALQVYEAGVLRNIEGPLNAEGISGAGIGKILVIEDRKNDGRLLRIEPSTGDIDTLLTHLKQGEGVCQSPTGEIYYVEKARNRLSQYVEGEIVVLSSALRKPGYLNCLADGSILITEDRTNFGRLLHYKNGEMKVLATRLRSPQSIIIGKDGDYYLAEQRRDRILIISGN